jgi:ABC-2 type transport system ATP-binding protein
MHVLDTAKLGKKDQTEQATAGRPVIEVSDLRKVFKLRQPKQGWGASLQGLLRPTYREVTAVQGVSFSVPEGETLAFIGPNGAGKSTTIKMLTGILYPSSGSAKVLGLTPWQQRQLLSFNISSVFGQKSQLWYHLPPLDTFNLLARIYELEPDDYKRRRDWLVELFEIAPYLHTPARKLSLGERMRCEIAASLLHRPRIIFLDEPTIGLDVIAKQRIRDLIHKLNVEEKITVFLTSHDAGDIEQVCRRVIVVNHGTIILADSVAALKREYLGSKVIELRLLERIETNAEAISSLALPHGLKLLAAEDYALKFSLDTGLAPIEQVMSELLRQYPIADLTINDPPMEEIIASIYGMQQTTAIPLNDSKAEQERTQQGGNEYA